MARTEYIAATTGYAYGGEFALSPGVSRRFYANPGLQQGERVEAQRKTSSGWQSLGLVITADGVEAGLVSNDEADPQTYRLIKSATDAATAIDYDS